MSAGGHKLRSAVEENMFVGLPDAPLLGQAEGAGFPRAGVCGRSTADRPLNCEGSVRPLQAPNVLREFGIASFVLESKGCLVVVEAMFERPFGQADVFFLISVGADRCFVYERCFQALAAEGHSSFLRQLHCRSSFFAEGFRLLLLSTRWLCDLMIWVTFGLQL